MVEFFQALRNPDISFLRYALVTGILASVALGVVGTYVVARRISYVAGAIAHSALGGIGAGLYLQMKFELQWLPLLLDLSPIIIDVPFIGRVVFHFRWIPSLLDLFPILGAVASALVAGIAIGYVSLYARQREDTVIGAIWAIGMALGLIFLTKTPGYVEPMSYLFGNILLISKSDLIIVSILDATIIILVILLYDKFLAVCFDEEFARIRGVRVGFYYLLLICITALTVVLMVRIVGIVMVIALLTLPAAVASMFTRSLWQMMLLSTFFCMLFVVIGMSLSYIYDLPTGSNIILVAGGVYIATVLVNYALRVRKS